MLFCDFKSGGPFERNELDLISARKAGADNVMRKKMYLTCL